MKKNSDDFPRSTAATDANRKTSLIPLIISLILIGFIWFEFRETSNQIFFKFAVFFVVAIDVLIYRKIWSQSLEKLGRAAFLAPLIIWSFVFLFLYRDLGNSNSLALAIILIAGFSSHHWWKMARDEKYKTEHKKYWLAQPWYKRNNAQFGLRSDPSLSLYFYQFL